MKENEKSLKLNMAHAGMALFITFVMYIMMCLVCKIAPFGNHTWLVYEDYVCGLYVILRKCA